jgi:hypothetical protein
MKKLILFISLHILGGIIAAALTIIDVDKFQDAPIWYYDAKRNSWIKPVTPFYHSHTTRNQIT